MAKKVGKPRIEESRVYNENGIELPYIRIDNQTNFYVRWKDDNGKWKKKNLGRNRGNAFLRYEHFLSNLQGDKIISVQRSPYQKSLGAKGTFILSDKFHQLLEEKDIDPSYFLQEVFESIEIKEADIPISICLQRAGEFIREDPKTNLEKAANLMGIPQIRYITSLKKSRLPLTLDEVKDYYFTQAKFKGNLSTKQRSELKEVEKSWERFCKTLKSKTIDIDFELIQAYFDDIYNEFNAGGKYIGKEPKSTTWINHHFERVKRVINGAINRTYGDDSKLIEEFAKKCSKALSKQQSIKKYPARKIKIDEFHELLKVSNIEERAMWLLSMNCAYYTVDVATVPLTAFDWIDKTVIFRRGKTEHKGSGNRAAILWDETINAIKEYQRERPHLGKTLFLNMRDKVPYSRKRIAHKFRACRSKAKIDNKIIHPNFRDSFRTVGAILAREVSVDTVMGHKPFGNRGDYQDPEEHPELAREACMGVHNYYFGEQENKQ